MVYTVYYKEKKEMISGKENEAITAKVLWVVIDGVFHIQLFPACLYVCDPGKETHHKGQFLKTEI